MRRNSRAFLCGVGVLLGLVSGGGVSRLIAASAPVAEVRVDGVGLFRDHELRAALKRLLDSNSRATLDANAIEDAAVILSSSLGEEGFQKPETQIEAILEDGTAKKFIFDPTFANPLPRPIAAREVKFKLKPGVRYHIDE